MTIVQQENILQPIAIGNLLLQEKNRPKYRFFIPSYQRGYRWDKDQVTDLLDDFYEFIITSKNTEDKYCLQPIVVKQLSNGKYEVLDGQQRLTTIYILLARLKQANTEIDLFSLEYETRPDSEIFLTENIFGEIDDSNPDYYYMSLAYKTIDKWLAETKKIKPNISSLLFNKIADSIEFIWYQILNDSEGNDAIDVFTRINIGKIPLTNSELVKAVFLSKNNLSLGYASGDTNEKSFDNVLSLKQNAIALQWDQMEKVLQDPKVWGFIYGGTKLYDTRIDYLLDLKSHATDADSEKNKYFSFKFFYDKIQAVRNDKDLLVEISKSNTSFIEQEWNKLKEVFDILLEWYHNKTFNHLIGYLISQKQNIISIVEEFQTQNRSDFKNKLIERISTLVSKTDISKLRYGTSDNDLIERILLLHNVISSLNINDDNIRFPFDKINNKQWTLEHIYAQNSDELREEDYTKWLEDHLNVFKVNSEDKETLSIVLNIKKLLTKVKKIEKEEFQDCFIKVESYIQNKINAIDEEVLNSETNESIKEEYAWINEDHSIANLALLDGSINSSIKNSLFDIKRKLILQKDKEGLFIPSETKKVFLKYYTPMPNHLAYWTFEDRKAYVDDIKSILTILN